MTHWIPSRKPRRRAQLGLALTGEVAVAPLTIIEDSLSEAEIQRNVLDLLAKHPRIAFAFRLNTASGFIVSARDWKSLLAGGIARAVMARFIRFAFPGASDILGMLKGGRFLAIECKTESGRASDEQLAFLAVVHRYGGLSFIARSIDDVLAQIPLQRKETTHGT